MPIAHSLSPDGRERQILDSLGPTMPDKRAILRGSGQRLISVLFGRVRYAGTVGVLLRPYLNWSTFIPSGKRCDWNDLPSPSTFDGVEFEGDLAFRVFLSVVPELQVAMGFQLGHF
jgi:hypothetical protein